MEDPDVKLTDTQLLPSSSFCLRLCGAFGVTNVCSVPSVRSQRETYCQYCVEPTKSLTRPKPGKLSFGQGLEAGDSTLQVLRADELFRRAPFFGSLLRHGD